MARRVSRRAARATGGPGRGAAVRPLTRNAPASLTPRDAIARLRHGAPLVLLLDLDGTLADFKVDPKSVRIPAAVRRDLATISRRANTGVSILTGRRAREAERIVGLPSVEIVGAHGREELRRGRMHRHPVPARARAALTRLLAAARFLVAHLPGSHVEDKRPAGIALHTRGAADAPALAAERVFAAAIRGARREGVDLLHGKRITEARSSGIDKGTAAAARAAAAPRDALVIFAGDDVTDEDAHRALAHDPRALTILVAKAARPTAAKLRLAGIPAMRRFLRALAGA